jgi:hypothetical protein
MLVSASVMTDLTFSIKRRTAAILCEGLYIFLNGGNLSVDNEPVQLGVPNCFPVLLVAESSEGRGRSLIQAEAESRSAAPTTGENPVAPDAPQSQAPHSSGIDPTPTPVPTSPSPTPTRKPKLTPTPTPEPVEEEEEEEEEEKPVSTCPGCPACPTCPPPPPTPTPASPVLP